MIVNFLTSSFRRHLPDSFPGDHNAFLMSRSAGILGSFHRRLPFGRYGSGGATYTTRPRLARHLPSGRRVGRQEDGRRASQGGPGAEGAGQRRAMGVQTDRARLVL